MSNKIIATNVADEIKDNLKLDDFKKYFGEFNISNYVTKQISDEDVVKTIFENFDILGTVNSVNMEHLESLLLHFYNVIKSKKDVGKISIWFREVSKPPVVNVSFSIEKEEDVSIILDSFVKFLKEKKSELKNEVDKIYWFTYDSNSKCWFLKII